ncbi:hypothetical protein HGRIS_014072 [Hohenbuehelia grisea]|uniref:Uncharacterized protein n=1 Tax=Hohenbuehelia grisea TaxID=104357 RepID=A0ABR3JTZ2_9AGAR
MRLLYVLSFAALFVAAAAAPVPVPEPAPVPAPELDLSDLSTQIKALTTSIVASVTPDATGPIASLPSASAVFSQIQELVSGAGLGSIDLSDIVGSFDISDIFNGNSIAERINARLVAASSQR